MSRVLACGCTAATVFVLACLSSASAAQVDQIKAQYHIVYSGKQYESFSAHGTLQGGGVEPGVFVGCDYTEEGDTTVHWRDVWTLTAYIHPASGHVTLDETPHLDEGPFNPKAPGDSEIFGTSTEGAGMYAGCTKSGRIGKFDCTSEITAPSLSTLVFAPETKTTFSAQTIGYLELRATYEGLREPSGLNCAGKVGTNDAPGGLSNIDFTSDFTGANFSITKAELRGLEVGKSISVDGLKGSYGKGWSDAKFPRAGEACHFDVGAYGKGEICHYDSGDKAPQRSAKLTIERVMVKK